MTGFLLSLGGPVYLGFLSLDNVSVVGEELLLDGGALHAELLKQKHLFQLLSDLSLFLGDEFLLCSLFFLGSHRRFFRHVDALLPHQAEIVSIGLGFISCIEHFPERVVVIRSAAARRHPPALAPALHLRILTLTLSLLLCGWRHPPP